MTKRPEIPGIPPQRSRNDQFAGFLFGILKGALIAAFVAAAHPEVRAEADRDDPLGRGAVQVLAGPPVESAVSPGLEDLEVGPGPSSCESLSANGPEGPAGILALRGDREGGGASGGADREEGRQRGRQQRSAPRDAPPAPPAPPATTTRQEAAREVEGVLDEIKAAPRRGDQAEVRLTAQ